jgi:hypothetical protein
MQNWSECENGFACDLEEHELHIRHLLQRGRNRMPLASGNVGSRHDYPFKSDAAGPTRL